MDQGSQATWKGQSRLEEANNLKVWFIRACAYTLPDFSLLPLFISWPTVVMNLWNYKWDIVQRLIVFNSLSSLNQ